MKRFSLLTSPALWVLLVGLQVQQVLAHNQVVVVPLIDDQTVFTGVGASGNIK